MNLRSASTAIALPLAVTALGVVPALAVGGSGLSLNPPIVQHAAQPGPVGSVTIANATGQAMNINVTPHPWLQSASGSAVPNQRVVLRGVRASASSFTLADGASKVVSLDLLGMPPSGSLYGNIEVTGVPTQRSHAPGVINFEYRLIGSLRLDPLHPSFGARAGRVVESGNRRRGALALAIRNTGNTIAPIGGSVSILRGARRVFGGSIAPVRILPGATVNAQIVALTGTLPAGSYTASASLSQSGRHVLSVKRGFRLR